MLTPRKKAILYGIGFFLLSSLVLSGQSYADKPAQSKGQLKFSVDAAGFWADPETSFLEVYYKIPYEALQFLKRDDLYKAQFDLSIVLYDQRGAQVTGNRWEHPIEIKDLTEANVSYAYSQVRFVVDPAEYKIKVKLEDLHNKKTGSAEMKVTLGSFPAEGVSLGTIQFAEFIETDTTATPFTKHQYRIVPNTTRIYGENQVDFYYYCELYTDEANLGSYQMQHALVTEGDSVAISEQKPLNVTERVTPFIGHTDISDLEEGVYKLSLTVKNVNTGKEYRNAKEFRIVWSPIAWGNDYKQTLHQILYIATEEELDEFEKLEDADSKARTDFMIEFWAKRDPIPRTPQNEYMIEHYRRFQYANDQFGGAIDGWRTDRGRIYIKFGEPDEIERHPFNFDSRPYEIWRYYKCGYRFVFVDEDGYGRYRLVSPATEEVYSDNCY